MAWSPGAMGAESRSRFTSMLLGILNGRFKGDAQNDIESWERDIRSFEKQTSFEIPDFVNAGILINGLQEEPLRRHMVLHTSRLDTYEKLRLEVTENPCYITWAYFRKYGGTPNCKACAVDGPSHSKECRERFEVIFLKEDEEKALKDAAAATAASMAHQDEVAAFINET